MKYIDLFAGIGGFALALNKMGHECVYSNEWDCSAAQTYEKNFTYHPSRPIQRHRDKKGRYSTKCPGHQRIDVRSISDVPTSDIPDHDLLVGGFPCQSFSIAGKRRGFEDTRGTMFYEIARIVRDKRPTYLLLENVKGLLNHEDGRTFETIMRSIDELGYDAQWQILNSKNYGVPQNRERVFIIANLRGKPRPQVFPIGANNSADIVIPTLTARYYGGQANGGYIGDKKVTIGALRQFKDEADFREMKSGISPTLLARARNDGSSQPIIISRHPRSGDPKKGGTGPLTSKDHAFTVDQLPHRVIQDVRGLKKSQNGKGYKDGVEESYTVDTLATQGIATKMRVRRLTPIECERLQGFEDNWTEGVSDAQRYKQLGNAVTVNVVQELVKLL